jgi:asparagine synthase (glutamine-hydrolysing)
MCGIAGIFDMRSGVATELDTIERMVATLHHRGPDARGARVYDGGRCGLGHARLSILDLSPEANQPFESDDGQLSITYNGEIFNFVELKEELEAKGHRFRTTCDTEVLLHAYDEWGDDAVNRLNGMWAFAILDRRRGRLFCSRDRFGIKPFAYARHRGRFIFGSEIKAILAAEPELARPDWTSLSMLLRSSEGYRLTESCFENVFRIPPAHNLVVTADGIEIKRYWDYPVESDPPLTMEEAAEEVHALLLDAIRIRMRSDVPVGSTVSGGVDSSSVVCLLRTFYEGPHETFTASYPGFEDDEAGKAGALSRQLGMSPNPVPALVESFLDLMQNVVRHVEGPNREPSVLPLWNIMKTARKKVTCLLEGQGADELLAGYPHRTFVPLMLDHFAAGRPGQALKELRCQSEIIGKKDVLLWAARTAFPRGQALFTRMRGDAYVLSGEFKSVASGPTDRDDPPPPIRGHLNRELREEHEGSLVPLLHHGDAMSMAHSVESRLPFMDVRLVEAVFRMPGELKVQNGLGKAVLRRAVHDVVPHELLYAKRKLGFFTPLSRWFRDEVEQTVYPVLLSDRCLKRGIFDADHLRKAIERHRAGQVDLSNYIFRWIGTELWFREFIDAS